MKNKGNYTELYNRVMSGEIILCFIDMSWPDRPDRIFRDPCQCRSTRPKEITFTARGTGYGGIESWEDIAEENRLSEFIKFCEKYNVEWVV